MQDRQPDLVLELAGSGKSSSRGRRKSVIRFGDAAQSAAYSARETPSYRPYSESPGSIPFSRSCSRRRLVLDDDRDLAERDRGTRPGSRRSRDRRAARTRPRGHRSGRCRGVSRAGVWPCRGDRSPRPPVGPYDPAMKVVHTERHRAHDPTVETYLGVPIPANEVPARVDSHPRRARRRRRLRGRRPTGPRHGADPRRARPGPRALPRGGVVGGRCARGSIASSSSPTRTRRGRCSRA